MTSKTLIEVLGRVKNSIPARDILSFRTACELARTIATELGQEELATELIGRATPRLPKAIRPSAKSRTGPGGAKRKANKNADHQTIPRFEQLVDLGFLDKPDEGSADKKRGAAERKKWRYRVTDACERWSFSLQQDQTEGPFLWHSFARTCLALQGISTSERVAEPSILADYLDRAYEIVSRTAGYNPLDSVALVAMILAINDGVRIEMSDFHRLMLSIKQGSRLPNHAYFASGNDLDRMFILLKPGFAAQVRKLTDLHLNIEQHQ